MPRFPKNAMTVAQLIALLEGFDNQDLPVALQYDYGDITHTQALIFPDEAEAVRVTESAYSASGFAVLEDDDEEGGIDEDEEKGDGEQLVVAIRTARYSNQ